MGMLPIAATTLLLAYSVAAMPAYSVDPPQNITAEELLHLPDEVDLDFHETNPTHTRYGRLVEGDVLLHPDEQRKGISSGSLWENRQYNYQIKVESIRAAAEAGIKFWRENTCIKFTEVSSYSRLPRVEFLAGNGCWSHIGCVAKSQSARTQQLSLGGGCTRLGTVTHEIGHSLGFFHEQSRSDRDDYVTILLENVRSSAKHNFRKVSTTQHFGVPYDLGSVMHYGTKFFSRNGEMTIRTKDPTKQSLIGQRVSPSFRDIALMNRMYKCEELCSSKPSCLNGGYVSDDCRCHCPPNTSGASCQTVTGPYYPEPVCGGVVASPGTITSPDWPAVYPPGSDCTWKISPPAGRRARVTFNQFNILFRVQDQCLLEYMEISKSGVLGNGERSCASELVGKSATSSAADGSMLLRFKAFRMYYAGKGFTATVQFV